MLTETSDAVRGRVDDLTRRNAAHLAGVSTGADAGDDWRRDAGPGGVEDQLALNAWQRAGVEALLKANKGMSRRIDRVLTEISAGAVAPGELPNLRDRVLDKATMKDIDGLKGVYVVGDKPPVYVTPDQKAVMDGLVGRLGDDDLARRTRSAYGQALSDGRVRVLSAGPRK